RLTPTGIRGQILDVPPPSLASQLPQGFAVSSERRFTAKTVGVSLLAIATFSHVDVGCADVIASRLTPTGIRGQILDVPPPSLASQLPQGFAVNTERWFTAKL
ncbi:hypothetical protein, partial [Pseudomonas sp. GM80]|uniref:hypothetical protein n=1 Tax=Pseudomonas sp. GM80 TaxID=1144339 RepID=UPI0005EBDC2F